MAVAYASFATSGWITSGPASVAKPASLAVGDILIVHYTANSNGGSDGAGGTTFSGYTTLQSQLSGSAGESITAIVAWKVADASDVAASTFSFGPNDGNSKDASLIRITGASSSGILSAGQFNGNTLSPVITGGITQTAADNLYIMLVSGTDEASSVSGYAVVTSNPTPWTEIYDANTTADDDHYHAAAYSAVRPQKTSTGNASASITGTNPDTFLVFVALRPPITISLAETVTLTEAMTLRMAYVTVIREIASLTEAVTALVDKWTRAAKSTYEDWVNGSKP